MSEASKCPVCDKKARGVYPVAYRWRAHPCGCKVTDEQAERLYAEDAMTRKVDYEGRR